MEEFKRSIKLVKNFKSGFKNSESSINLSNNNFANSFSTFANSTNSTNRLSKNASKTKLIALNSKIDYYLEKIQFIKEIEPNIKYFKSVIYEYHKAVSLFYVDKSIFDALKILFNIINAKKHFMPAHFQIWKILNFLQDYKLLLDFSYFTIKVSHLNEVAFNDWTQSYVYYAKALYLNGKSEEAVNLLKNVLDVFSITPLEKVKLLSEIAKSNSIASSNVFENFDKALTFYSKYHVFQKNEEIFENNFSHQRNENSLNSIILELNEVRSNGSSLDERINIPEIPTPSKTRNKFNEINIINANEIEISSPNKYPLSPNVYPESPNPNYQNELLTIDDNFYLNGHTYNSFLFQKDANFVNASKLFENKDKTLKDIEVNNKRKVYEFIHKEIDEVEIPNESPCNIFLFILVLTIVSNPIILYQLGKICAKSGVKKEIGVVALQDYIQIMKFQNNYKLDNYNDQKKQKAYFWMCVLHIELKQYK